MLLVHWVKYCSVFVGFPALADASSAAHGVVGRPSVFAADMDGDGDMDVVSASTGDDKIAWYENDGSQNFTAHTSSRNAGSANTMTVIQTIERFPHMSHLLAFILFVILGGLLVLRWRRLVWLHVPAALWGALIEFAGWICPLTPLGNWLHRAGGEAEYSTDFIEHYVLPVIYPSGLTCEITPYSKEYQKTRESPR